MWTWWWDPPAENWFAGMRQARTMVIPSNEALRSSDSYHEPFRSTKARHSILLQTRWIFVHYWQNEEFHCTLHLPESATDKRCWLQKWASLALPHFIYTKLRAKSKKSQKSLTFLMVQKPVKNITAPRSPRCNSNTTTSRAAEFKPKKTGCFCRCLNGASYTMHKPTVCHTHQGKWAFNLGATLVWGMLSPEGKTMIPAMTETCL